MLDYAHVLLDYALVVRHLLRGTNVHHQTASSSTTNVHLQTVASGCNHGALTFSSSFFSSSSFSSSSFSFSSSSCNNVAVFSPSPLSLCCTQSSYVTMLQR